MFSNNLIMSIYVDGKLLSDNNGKVYLPFGCEYEIHFKNTDHRDCGITELSIDGENIFKDANLVVRAGQKKAIRGVSKAFDKSLNKDYAFKFIQKTEKISEFRGDRQEDGLITVKFGFEMEDPFKGLRTSYAGAGNPVHLQGSVIPKGGVIGSGPGPQNSVLRSMSGSSDKFGSDDLGFMDHGSEVFAQASLSSQQPAAEKGITVKGREIEQDFKTVYMRPFTDFGSMTVQLYSEVKSDTPVSEPIYSKGKVQCEVCGIVSPNKYKFCPECSANLH